jgi:flagellar biosynthesis/type III secretory pathway protein FliH
MDEPEPQQHEAQPEEADRRASGPRRISPALTVTAAILIAAIAGFSLGKGSKPEEPDPATVRQEAIARAGEATLTEVRRRTALQGYRQGRSLGTRQGRKSGKAVGKADGQIQAQVILARSAQSAADSAEAALAGISAPPPAP